MSDMACVQGAPHLMDYLEDVLPADLRATIDMHVAACAKCRAFIASYQATPVVMREALSPDMPPEVQQSMRAFIDSLTRGHGHRG